MKLGLINIGLLLATVITGVVAQLFLKKGLTSIEFNLHNLSSMVKTLASNPNVILWVLLGACSAITWVLVVWRLELSFLFPVVTSFSVILVALLAGLMFGEHISVVRWLGIFIVCGGIFLVAK